MNNKSISFTNLKFKAMQIKKSEKANIEKKKTTFLLLGLVFSLSFCLFAFEWTSKEVSEASLGDMNMGDVFEEEIENTIQDVPPPEVEPEQPEPETVIEELTIVENDIKVANVDINSEADEKTKTNTNIVKFTESEVVEEEVEAIAFAVVEDKPTFPGGDAALMKFIAENTKYPEIAKENSIQGRVYIQFVIDKVGNVTKVTVAKGVDPYLDNEAVRVVKTLPKWSPGKQRGKPVPVTYIVPINFKLY